MNKEEQEILSVLSIMYIEDDNSIRASVAQTLSLIFKEVLTFENAEDAFIQFKSEKPDMILSDINLPSMSGIEFSKLVRKDDYNIPIILLTAYTNKEILLEATKLKLISYIVKPVVFDELYESFKLAAKDIIRTCSNHLIFSNNTKYDVHSKLLYFDNKEVNMTSSENRLLEIFINNLNKTVSINDIKDQLWDDAYDATDSALKSVLSKLRSKIGKDSIKNISGMGYYLVTSSTFH
mgnify:CR=1 FL=1